MKLLLLSITLLAIVKNNHHDRMISSHWAQGRNDGWGKGAHLPGRRIIMGVPNHCGCAKKSQQFHNYFLQYSKFPSERPHVRTWGAKLASCPGRNLTSYTPD